MNCVWVSVTLLFLTFFGTGDSELDPRKPYDAVQVTTRTSSPSLDKHTATTSVSNFDLLTKPAIEEIIQLLRNEYIIHINQIKVQDVFERVYMPCMVMAADKDVIFTDAITKSKSARVEWHKGPEEQDSVVSVNEYVVHLHRRNDYLLYPDNYTLVIKNLSMDLTGYYTCKVVTKDSSYIVAHYGVGLNQTAKVGLQTFESGKSITLPCHPDLENSSIPYKTPKYHFEWVTDNDVPIYTEGRFSPHLFVNDPDKTSYSIRNSSLVIRKLKPDEIATFKCILKERYTEFSVKVKMLAPVDESTYRYHVIDSPKDDETLILDNDEFPAGNASFVWLLRRQNYQHSEELVEVISLNDKILYPGNFHQYSITSKGSLIIYKFKPAYQTYYECYFSSGLSIVYNISMRAEKNKPDARITWINETIHVKRGDDVLLRCPLKGKAKFIWTRNFTENLFITGVAFMKYSSSDHFKMSAIDQKSLVIKDFSAELNGLYSCISKGFRYFYNVTEQDPINGTVISGFKIGRPVILNCPPRFVNESSYVIWTRDGDYLYIDGEQMEGWHENLQIGGEDKRSLIIKSYSNRDNGLYSCYLHTGKKSVHNITGQKNGIEEKIMVIDFGTRNVLLPCPANNNTDKVDYGYEWRLESSSSNYSSSYINFTTSNHPAIILFVNGDKFTPLSLYRNFYDVDENGSLIIKLINSPQYGIYTCRRFSGQQYVYQINKKVESEEKPLSIIQGSQVVLPCPPKGPSDEESNVIRWTIELSKIKFYAEYQFFDTKVMSQRVTLQSVDLTDPNQPIEEAKPDQFSLPSGIQISENKLLLKVLNFTAAVHPGSYSCKRILSDEEFNYRLYLKICDPN